MRDPTEPFRPAPTLVALLLLTVIAAVPTSAQYTLSLPPGDTLTFEESTLQEMLGESRELRRILEEDPDVLYYMGSGPEVTASSPEASYPWNAVRVVNDSVARVATPANYRESERAYVNYAVEKMRHLREKPPTASCDTAVEREVQLVEGWIDGWILARTLYGGPAFPTLDALAFARDEGHLAPLLVRLGNTGIGACVEAWRRAHPEEVAAFEAWYRASHPGAREDREGA